MASCPCVFVFLSCPRVVSSCHVFVSCLRVVSSCLRLRIVSSCRVLVLRVMSSCLRLLVVSSCRVLVSSLRVVSSFFVSCPRVVSPCRLSSLRVLSSCRVFVSHHFVMFCLCVVFLCRVFVSCLRLRVGSSCRVLVSGPSVVSSYLHVVSVLLNLVTCVCLFFFLSEGWGDTKRVPVS